MRKALVAGDSDPLATADGQCFRGAPPGGREQSGPAASRRYFVFGRSSNLHLLQICVLSK